MNKIKVIVQKNNKTLNKTKKKQKNKTNSLIFHPVTTFKKLHAR